jgi:hypothetical protein
MIFADIFVIFDTVQFTPRHEENRTRLKAPQGIQWITVPMRHVSREQLILDTRIDNTQTWQRRVGGTLDSLYSKAPYFKRYAQEISSIIEAPHETLARLDRASWEPAAPPFGYRLLVCPRFRSAVVGQGSEAPAGHL